MTVRKGNYQSIFDNYSRFNEKERSLIRINE